MNSGVINFSLLFTICSSLHVYGETGSVKRCSKIYQTANDQLKSSEDLSFEDLILHLNSSSPEKAAKLTQLSRLKFHKTTRDGRVIRFWDYDLGTYIYYGSTTIQTDKKIVLNQSAKGLVIYCPGAGTQNEGGHVFNYKANSLTRLGFDTISFDYPWNSFSERNDNLIKFLRRVIQKYSQEGVPITLVGHSFGTNLILEYMHLLGEDMKMVEGVVGFSPIGTDEGLTREWVHKFSRRLLLRRGIHIQENQDRSRRVGLEVNGVDGERSWFNGSVYSENFQQTYGDSLKQIKYRTHDPGFKTMSLNFAHSLKTPSVITENPKFRIVIGDNDEFLPRLKSPGSKVLDPDGTTVYWDGILNFKKAFPYLSLVKLSGVGHGVFRSTEGGQDVVIREILAGAGYKLGEVETELKKTQSDSLSRVTATDRFLEMYYHSEPGLPEWFKIQFGSIDVSTLLKKETKSSKRFIERVLAEYELFLVSKAH